MSLIETRGLCQRYGQRDVLKNIDIKVERGEVFAIIGPNGAGKTTLLRLLDLLDYPTSGQIYFGGRDMTELGRARLEVRRRIAFVLQKPVVFNLTVYDNIAYGLKCRGIGRRSLHQKVSRIVEIVGLSDAKNRNARTLSGGEVQRVAIARAVATEPELLLLDELTANLDPTVTTRIEELITNIRQQYDTTIIMATHDQSQAQRLADRLGVLLNGEIVQTGSGREVFSCPQSRRLAEFVGAENILDGVIASNESGVVAIDIGGRVIEAISDYPAGEEVSACVRPEDVTLMLAKMPSSARNSFSGEITRLVPVGPLIRMEVDCGFALICLVTRKSVEELNLVRGKPVYASFKASGVHVIRRGS